MNKTKRIVSLLLAITLIIGMLPLSVFPVYAEDTTNTNEEDYSNIPHGNVTVNPTDRYMTGNGNVSGSKIRLEKYYNPDGLLVDENVSAVYGNVLYCYSYIPEIGEYNYYLKSILDGSILYADKEYLSISEYAADSSMTSKKNASQLIRVGDYTSYDVVNVITGEVFDYNFDYDIYKDYDRNPHFIGDTAIVSKEGKYGIMGTDGELIVDLIFNNAYYTEDKQAIIVRSTESGYGVYNIDGSVLVKGGNSNITYYPSAKLFRVVDDGSYSSNVSSGDALDTTTNIINLDGDIVFSACTSQDRSIGNVKELDDALLVTEIILDATTWWGSPWKHKGYIVNADGKVIDIAERYGASYTDIESGCVNDNSMLICCYSADGQSDGLSGYISYNGVYENLSISYYGYIDYDGNMLLDYTDYVEVNESKTRIDHMPYLRGFIDGYAVISLDFNSHYVDFINKQGIVVSNSFGKGLTDSATYRKENVRLTLNSSGERLNGFYDLYDNPLAVFEGNASYSQTDPSNINENSRTMFVLYTTIENDEGIMEKRYGVFFTRTKEFTGFIYKSVRGLLEENEDYQVISCNKPDGTSDVYNSLGILLFNNDTDNFYRFNSGNILVIQETGEEQNTAGAPLSKLYKIIDVNGSEIYNNSNYRFVKKLEDDTFAFASTIDIQNNGDSCIGVMNARGKIVVSPRYDYDRYTNHFDYLKHGYYLCFTGIYGNGGFHLVNEHNKEVLHLNGSPSDDVTESGTVYYYDYSNDEIYLYWLNGSFEFQNGLTLCSENNKNTLAIGEKLTIYVKTDSESLMQYGGTYSVRSSNPDTVKIETQGTGIVSAVLTGETIGETDITITFDDGREVYATFSVGLSNENVLQYFPESVMDNEADQIFSKAVDCCYQINNLYSGWDDVVASYFTSLKSGGAKVITQHVLEKLGLSPSLHDEYVDEAVLALMNEICNVDTTFSDAVSSNSKKWSTAKSHYKATNESFKEFSKYAATISNFSESDIIAATSEVMNAYGDGISLMGEFVDVYDIVAVVICTESIQIDVVNKLLNVIEPGTDLYDGLLRFKIELSTGFLERVSTQYIRDKIIDDIASSLIQERIVGLDSYYKMHTALAKICIKLIIDKYTDAGGVMAKDLCLAIYTTTFAGQIECALNAELLNYCLGQVEDYSKFEWLYNCYTASLCVALEHCAAICKSSHAFLKDDANKYLKLIKYNWTFDNFMEVSRKTATNSYPVEYQVGLDENGEWILIKKYEKIAQFSLRSNQATSGAGEIIYIPSVIDGNIITSIADGAFKDNLDIKGVIIEDGIKSIGSEAFKGCLNLEFVMLGGVSEIGEDAFSDCTALELISLSPNMKTIKSGTFKNCQSLVSLTVPENIESIEENAFDGCSSLNAISFLNDEINLDQFGLGESSQLTDIYGREGSSAEEYAITNNLVFHAMLRDVISLEITALPKKLEFNCGEEIDTTGMELLATFDDGSQSVVYSGFGISYSNVPGDQLVSVYYRNAEATYQITLTEETVSEIALNISSLELVIGETAQLEITNSIPNYFQDEVVWHSSDESIASVNDGLISAISNGSVVITASLDDSLYASCTVNVNNKKDIAISTDNRECSEVFVAPVSGYYTFYANGTSITAYHQDGSIARYGENKILVYLEKDATILLTFEKSYYTLSQYTLQIDCMRSRPNAVTVSSAPHKQYCYKGIKESDLSGLEILFTYSDGTTLTWQYDNQVDVLGSYPQIQQTENRIHVFWEELYCSYDLEYREYAEIKLSEPQNANVKRNYSAVYRFVPETTGSYGLYVNPDDTNFDRSDITITLFEKKDDYLAEAVKSSEYIKYEFIADQEYVFCISGDYNHFETIEIIVSELTDAQSMNIVSSTGFSGYVNDIIELDVEFLPITAEVEEVAWSSNNESVAVVDEAGTVTLLNVGTATITATSEGGLTSTCTIEVTSTPLIICNEEKEISTETDSGIGLYKFVPEEDGKYVFYSYNNEFDTYGYLLDASMQVIDSDDDSGDGSNFRIEYSMTAGTTYYLKAKPYSSSYSGTYHITVARLNPATGIEITAGDSISRYEGSGYYLSAKFNPDNAVTESLTWTSSNTDVATVTSFGYVNFIAAGTATITVTSENGLTDSIEVVVKAPTVISVGETKTGFADLGCTADIFEFTPTEGGVYRVTVESPNHSYLNIRDSEGNYLANKGGYNMTADQAMTAGSTYRFEMVFADPNLSGNFTIKVEKLVSATGMEIVQGEMISGYQGGGYWSLTVKFTPDNAAPESVTWTSSDPLVATVDDLGRVKYVAAGTATITATSQNGYTDTITVVVKAYPVLTEETPCDVTIENNEDVYIRFIPETSGNYRIYYTNLSYDGNRPHFVLEQNNSWLKQGDEYLDCYLEADTEYLIGTWFSSYSPPGNGSYTVCIAEIGAAESMQIDQGDAVSGFKGEIIHLSTTFSPEICMQESVSWTSSNNEVATVAENGRVNMLSVGTAIITATSENGLTDTITITVKGYPTIQEGTETDTLIDAGGMASYFSFTPEEDGYYAFYASTDSDTLGYIMDEELNILASDDDNGEGYNFKVKYQMEAGKTYILKARYYGSEETGTIKVCIEKTRYIASLEVTALPTRLDYVKEHVYNISYKGLKLKATWSDGSVSNWSCNSDGYFNNMIEDEYISFDTDSCETSGEIIVSCGGQTTCFHINLVDNPVDHIEVVSPSSHKYIENYNGYEMYGGGYYYYTNTPTDAVIKIVYQDGSSVTANVGDVVDYYSISWEHNQYDKAWVVGSENESTVTYLGHTVNLPITVEKNKVESIEVVSGKVTCIENAYGYDMGNGYYYYYSVPEDVTVKVNYTDGSSVTTNIHDILDGYSFSWNADQYSDPWTLGDDNYVTISYLGVTGKLPVSVIASPVDHIVINTAPTREYFYGDSEWGWLYSDGDYEFYPSDMTGISFTVHYTNGTTKTFTSADIDDQGLIDGYGYSLSYDEYVSEPGDIPVTFSYMGKSAEYTVKLKESQVESLNITKLPSATQFGSAFAPDFVGAEFTITFADGSTKSVILTDSNVEYEYDWEYGLTYIVDVDGHALSIRPIYAESGKYYRASYIDQSVDIREISFTDEQEISSIVLGNVTSTGDNMNIAVTYQDGSTESLRLDATVYDDYGDEIEGYAKTEKGMLYYGIVTNKDTNGDVISYEVRILGHTVEVEATDVVVGDINNDGVVDLLDRMVLSRYLANWDGYTAETINMQAADVNEDGVVDPLDRMVLSRYLANWSGYEDLPFAS